MSDNICDCGGRYGPRETEEMVFIECDACKQTIRMFLRKTDRFNRATIVHGLLLALLFLATGIMASFRFGSSYLSFSDSRSYLDMVDFFKGDLPLSMTRAPFNYRVLMPLIVSLLGVDPELGFSVLNYILLFPLAIIMYLIPREFGFGRVSSTCAALLCMVSHPVLAYGGAVLVEVPFMLFLSLGVLGVLRQWNAETIYIITVVGVLFKETAVLIALVYMLFLWRTNGDWRKGLLVGGGAVIIHLLVRLCFIGSIGGGGWLWSFTTVNLTTRLITSLETVGYAFLVIGLPLLLAVLLRDDDRKMFWRAKWGFFTIAAPLSILVFVSFFFAAFAVRFFWPLYLGLLPMIAYGIRSVLIELHWMELGLKETEQ